MLFTPGLIHGIISKLKAYNDKELRKDILNDKDKIMNLVNQYFHCG